MKSQIWLDFLWIMGQKKLGIVASFIKIYVKINFLAYCTSKKNVGLKQINEKGKNIF